MRWKISDAKGSGTDYIGYAETTPLTEAMRDLWRKYLKDAAPLNADVAWDYLGVYIYLDSGRVILFPVVQASRFRAEKSTCQIICPDLLNFYETLAEAKLPDEQLEPQLIRKEKEIVELLSASAKDAHLPQRLGKPEIRILYYSYDSDLIKEDVLRS
jgi:hypothetical protein